MEDKKSKKPISPEGMGFYKIRSVGNGLSITVPNDFVLAEGLDSNTWVKISWSNHMLTVEPIKQENKPD
jgi:hypothetical protein